MRVVESVHCNKRRNKKASQTMNHIIFPRQVPEPIDLMGALLALAYVTNGSFSRQFVRYIGIMGSLSGVGNGGPAGGGGCACYVL